jgi:AI-2 transport protein TqsA
MMSKEDETQRLLEIGRMKSEESSNSGNSSPTPHMMMEMVETKNMKKRRTTANTSSSSAAARMRKSPSLESLDKIIEFDENNGKLLIHMITVPLIILATCAMGVILIFLKEILIPFVIAFFFVNILRPLISLLTTPIRCRRLSKEIEYRGKLYNKKHDSRVSSVECEQASLLNVGSRCVKPDVNNPGGSVMQCPHWLAVILSLLIVSGILTIVVINIAQSLKGVTDMKPADIEEAVFKTSNSTFIWLEENFNVDGRSILREFISEIKVADAIQYMFNMLLQSMMDMLLILLIVLYLLFEESFGETSGPTERGSFKAKIDSQIQQYIGLKTLISIMIGIAVYIILGPLLNVEYAHLLGVGTFFLNFIPNLGAFFATFITPIAMMVDSNSYSSADYILGIALPTACHAVVGNLIEPALFGKSLEIHPIIVLLALTFWYVVFSLSLSLSLVFFFMLTSCRLKYIFRYAIWGVTGAILAVPITAVIRITVTETNHPYAKFIQNILEGRLPSNWSKSLATRRKESNYDIHQV